MNVGSLFSGCGGLDLGLEHAGHHIVWACESDPACRRVLGRRWPELDIYPDVRELDGGTPCVDMLAGGFPCQDLSHAGRGVGLDGERSGLWFAMADAVRLLRPRLVLVENVPGLATTLGARAGESALGTVIADLAEAGYVGSWLRLRAADVGAPHGRERIFIVAADADTGRRDGRREARDGTEAQSDLGGLSTGRCKDAAAADAGSERLDGFRGIDSAGTAGAGQDGWACAPRPSATTADADAERWYGGREASASAGQATLAERGGLSAGRREDVAADPERARRKRIGTASGTSDGEEEADRPGASEPATADPGGEPGEPRHGRRVESGAHARAGAQERDGDGQLGATEPRAYAFAAHAALGSDTVEPQGDGRGAAMVGTVDRAGTGARTGRATEGVRELGRGARTEWGAYEPAIRRWELILGRPAPAPTDARGRLDPVFVEWMLGFPDGWTDGEKRTQRLRMLGNAVQVQCAVLLGEALA